MKKKKKTTHELGQELYSYEADRALNAFAAAVMNLSDLGWSADEITETVHVNLEVAKRKAEMLKLRGGKAKTVKRAA
jgi:nitrogen fixation protein FixH